MIARLLCLAFILKKETLLLQLMDSDFLVLFANSPCQPPVHLNCVMLGGGGFGYFFTESKYS